MRYFFIFLGISGIISLTAVVGVLIIGVPVNQKEIIKRVHISQNA